MSNQKLNAAFWKWFGDSKVVDSKGDPLVVYHGSRDIISEFDVDMCELGCHFGTKPQALDANDDFIYECYLSIKKPLRMVDRGEWSPGDVAIDFVRMGIANEGLLEHKRLTSSLVRTELRGYGYDGIVYLNRHEGIKENEIIKLDNLWASGKIKSNFATNSTDVEFRRHLPSAKDSWIVFNPSQVKEVDNDGTWDVDDAGIRSNPDEDDDDLEDWGSDEWMARYDKKIAASIEKIFKDAGDDYVVQFKRKDGMQLFLSQTKNSGKNRWQVSWVAADDTPLSDTIFKKRDDALLSIAGGGISPNIGQPGEWKVVATLKSKRKQP